MTIQSKTLYDTDFNMWLETTAQLLRKRQLSEIDYDNLIEEIEGMSNSQKDALESNLRILLMHLLKWKFQSSKRSNSWKYTLVEHCLRINKSFKKSPSLKVYFENVFEECYQDARLLASKETGMSTDDFPLECPFAKEDILNPEYLPDDDQELGI
ncbi:DUF29 domain-containing protein [Gloeothece verrucosa]|uniref:DUF29 domain-containing protein n=1 Tax=Gloeothece verrucosa (strain PCC 7822) TaxID=497965 RepID=E0UHM1_GLOV7|nr:DUF29 domain-containing protein [Gloeothece verrucosa]ADN13278.1 protein of unknown function DUF29 [Gloeothece verrucosa PCC 7822]